MATIERTGHAVWTGDLRKGKGRLGSGSGVLAEQEYTFATRFGDQPGTNPDELLATAHAACYSMALAATLGAKGHQVERIQTKATCILEPLESGGYKIARMRLETQVAVPGLAEASLREIAQEAERGCPVSNALRGGVEIELQVSPV